LRGLAHGIYPAILADEGLAAAVGALAEDAPAPLRIAALPQERFPPAVETAAYLLIAETVRAGPARVSATTRDGVLVVEVETEAEPERLVDLEDRIGALDGRLAVTPTQEGRVELRVDIPCE